MASYTGYILPEEQIAGYSANRPYWYFRPSWDRYWDENWDGGAFGNFYIEQINRGYLSSQGISGTYTDNRPIGLRESNWNGYVAPGFADIFYNRIVIEPTLIAFGSVLSDQTIEFVVWNAYFETKTLDNIVEQDFDEATEFSGETLPSDYYALEERTYDVSTTPAGPPTIEAFLIFDWEAPIANITVTITGSRITLMPVTYRSRMQESLEWFTDIIQSYNGKEQRRQTRLVPRQQLEIEAYLSKTEMQRIENRVYDSRERIWAIPIWGEARKATSPITQGDEVVNVSTLYGDFRVNSLAVIWEDPRNFDVFLVTGKTDTTLSLDRGINADYADPFIIPVRSARMIRDPERGVTGFDSVLRASFEVIDNIALPTSASAIQYLGIDTFFDRPDVPSADGSPNNYTSRVDVVDNISGLVELFTPWDNPKIGKSFQYTFEGLEDTWTFREWLHRRAGRLVPFYMPSFENNFVIVSEGTIGTTFEAQQNDYSLQLQQRDNIVFSMTDGSYIFRVITAAEILPNENLQVTIDTALNEAVEDIDEVSFFGLKRLTFDKISLLWLPNNVVQVDLSITEIEP